MVTLQKTFCLDEHEALDKLVNEFIRTHKVVASHSYGVAVGDDIFNYRVLFYIEEQQPVVNNFPSKRNDIVSDVPSSITL